MCYTPAQILPDLASMKMTGSAEICSFESVKHHTYEVAQLPRSYVNVPRQMPWSHFAWYRLGEAPKLLDHSFVQVSTPSHEQEIFRFDFSILTCFVPPFDPGTVSGLYSCRVFRTKSFIFREGMKMSEVSKARYSRKRMTGRILKICWSYIVH